MKFKRTIASVLTAIFSLNIMGAGSPKIFAKDDSKTTTKVTEKVPQEEINKKLNELDKQGELDELKEQIKKLEEKIKKNKKRKSKNKENKENKKDEENEKDENDEDSYISKDGIKNVLNNPFKILFSGTITLILEAVLVNLPGKVGALFLSLLGAFNLSILLPLIVMLSTALKLYEYGCKQEKQEQ